VQLAAHHPGAARCAAELHTYEAGPEAPFPGSSALLPGVVRTDFLDQFP
jgi:hypothetical protein